MPAAVTHIVDASALIAYFKGEQGHDLVAARLMDDRNNLAIHAVNLCEVYYGYLRADGPQKANVAWDKTAGLMGILETIGEDFMKRVARWKVDAGLGLGDAFVAACAEENAAIVLTADHTDFDPIQQAALICVEFIR